MLMSLLCCWLLMKLWAITKKVRSDLEAVALDRSYCYQHYFVLDEYLTGLSEVFLPTKSSINHLSTAAEKESSILAWYIFSMRLAWCFRRLHSSLRVWSSYYYIVMWCERPKCSQLTLNSDEDGGQKRERKKVVLQSNDRSPKPIWFLDHVIQETFSFFGEKKKIRVWWWCSQVCSSTSSILHAWGSGWLSQSFFSSSW